MAEIVLLLILILLTSITMLSFVKSWSHLKLPLVYIFMVTKYKNIYSASYADVTSVDTQK